MKRHSGAALPQQGSAITRSFLSHPAQDQRWILAGLDYPKSLGDMALTDPPLDAGKAPSGLDLLSIRRPDGASVALPPEKHRSPFLRCDGIKFGGAG